MVSQNIWITTEQHLREGGREEGGREGGRERRERWVKYKVHVYKFVNGHMYPVLVHEKNQGGVRQASGPWTVVVSLLMVIGREYVKTCVEHHNIVCICTRGLLHPNLQEHAFVASSAFQGAGHVYCYTQLHCEYRWQTWLWEAN